MLNQTIVFRPQWTAFLVLCGALTFCQLCDGQEFQSQNLSRESTGLNRTTPQAFESFSPERFTQARFDQYEQQLNAILKTRRDEEREYLSQIVALVRAGKLPSSMVQTSFQWVYKKRPGTKFPFIYFERVLRIQADFADIGAIVPAFDFGIYRQFDNGTRPFIRGGSRTTQGPSVSSDRTTFVR